MSGGMAPLSQKIASSFEKLPLSFFAIYAILYGTGGNS